MLAGDARIIDLDCGISHARIVSWLRDELALPLEGDAWLYSFDGRTCRVLVEPLEPRLLASSATLGALAIERAHLVAKGDPDALARFEKLFTLRFISAGG